MTIRSKSELYNGTFVLGFLYNFFMALNFSNNAIYPLYVENAGGNASTIGLFMGLTAFSAVISRPLIGFLIDRWGVKPVLIIGSITMSLPSLGYWALMNDGLVPFVWLLRIVHGFGFGAHFSAFFTLAAQTAPPSRRNEAIAMYGLSGLTANLIGPFLGEQVFEIYGTGSFFLMVTLFGLIASAIIGFIKVNYKANGSSTKFPGLLDSFKLIFCKKYALVFALSFLLAVAFSTPQFFLAPLAGVRGIESFGLYFTGYAIGGIGVRLVGRQWGDRFGVRRVMVPAYFLYALGLILIYFSTKSLHLAFAGISCGIGHGIAFPAFNTLGYNLASDSHKGTVMSLLTGMWDVGSTVTAIFFGIIATSYSYDLLFILGAVGGLFSIILLLVNILGNPQSVSSNT